MPVPKTEAVAEQIIAKVRTLQTRISVPFLLENISYMFEWPDSDMSDADFLNLICRETDAGLLLDLENLYLNSRNHGFDPHKFIDALPRGLVQEIHLAGGITVRENFLDRPFLADSHSHPVAMRRSISSIACSCAKRQRPSSWSVMTGSTPRMKSSMMSRASARELPVAIPGASMATRLLDRQVSLLEYLTSVDERADDRGPIRLQPVEGPWERRDDLLHALAMREACLKASIPVPAGISKSGALSLASIVWTASAKP
jgi:Protein of unknown function (DUF692)